MAPTTRTPRLIVTVELEAINDLPVPATERHPRRTRFSSSPFVRVRHPNSGVAPRAHRRLLYDLVHTLVGPRRGFWRPVRQQRRSRQAHGGPPHLGLQPPRCRLQPHVVSPRVVSARQLVPP